ncbi:MAG: prepilin peptidase [Desulfobacteraceae bacterium]|nr:MAG: prepilin peptidase [Desulfobacteraceae bacterium]
MTINILIFIFGLCIGSFMNVCIYRIPLSKSIVTPRSMCPGCGTLISTYDNIPVISYILLMGKCRNCGIHISLRYPLVETISGLTALAVFMRFGISAEGLVNFALISALVVITFIDIDHRIIPDTISLPGIPAGFLLASFFLPSMNYKTSLAGILTGGGSLFAVAWIYSLITKKEGMGGGDIKLLAMIGAFTGWKGILFTIFVASAMGTLVGIALMLKTQKDMKLAVPFGPFLSIGAILYIFFGTSLISWYFNLLAA